MSTPSPLMKKKTHEHLMEFLYADQRQNQRESIKAIINKNSALLASSHRSFIYKNELYVYDDHEKVPRIKNRLQRALVPKMEEWLEEQEQLEADEAFYVSAFLRRVFNVSNNLHDHLALLPDSLQRPVRELWHINPEDEKPNLSPEFIASFKEEHQQDIQILNKRLMKNLLLRQ